MSKLLKTENSKIIPFLERNSILNLFPLYVCRERPDEKSLVFFEGEQMLATIVWGGEFGLFPAWAPWLVADSENSALQIFSHFIEKNNPTGMQVPWDYTEALGRLIPEKHISRDQYLSLQLHAGVDSQVRSGNELVKLDNETVSALNVDVILRDVIGDLSDFPPGAPFWGLVADKRLIAVAETMVQTDMLASVQQVFTLPSFRRRGYAKELIKRIAGTSEVSNKKLTWLASEKNIPSLALARRVGFDKLCHFGCIENESQ